MRNKYIDDDDNSLGQSHVWSDKYVIRIQVWNLRPVGQFVWQSTECKSVRHVLEETESDLHHADSSSTPPSNVNCSKICVLLHSRIQQPVWAFRWNKTKYRTIQRPPPHFSFNWIDCSMQSARAQNIQKYSEYTAAMIFCLLQLLAFMLACKEQCVNGVLQCECVNWCVCL